MKKFLRFLDKNANLLFSKIRLLYFESIYEGLVISNKVFLGSGSTIKATDNGKIYVGENVKIGRLVQILSKFGTMEIGRDTFVGDFCTIVSSDKISVGGNCLIASGVTVRDQDHNFSRIDVPIRLQGSTSAGIVIGDDVWIGTNATILMGVTIGDQAIIGANSVVTKSIPPRAIAVGSPARVIKFRNG